jgi:hypothetical protein
MNTKNLGSIIAAGVGTAVSVSSDSIAVGVGVGVAIFIAFVVFGNFKKE